MPLPAPTSRQFVSGFDLGQAADFTALAVCEQKPADAFLDWQRRGGDPLTRPRRQHRYDVVHLTLWDLGTPYPQIAKDAAALFARDPLPWTWLAVDYTGVGRPVVDQLRAERVPAKLALVLITGGDKVTRDPKTGEWHVPKRELVSNGIALFQAGLVRVAAAKAGTGHALAAERLRKELALFTAKVNRRTANEQFGTWADGQHDDLVLALLLALWLGERTGAGSVADVTVQPDDQSTLAQASVGVFA